MIKLRQGVEFHNGKTLTADDAVYSLRRLTDPKLALDGGTGLLSVDRTKITKVDRYTVRLGLTRPDVTVPYGLASYTATMVPEGYTNTGKSWQRARWAPARSGSSPSRRASARSTRGSRTTGCPGSRISTR